MAAETTTRSAPRRVVSTTNQSREKTLNSRLAVAVEHGVHRVAAEIRVGQRGSAQPQRFGAGGVVSVGIADIQRAPLATLQRRAAGTRCESPHQSRRAAPSVPRAMPAGRRASRFSTASSNGSHGSGRICESPRRWPQPQTAYGNRSREAAVHISARRPPAGPIHAGVLKLLTVAVKPDIQRLIVEDRIVATSTTAPISVCGRFTFQ